ncbi:hypothetical protein PFISCL1PPCAC_11568 [Pristionchus fissidentatus]|uniref:Uncharacterized protein n=1 Tax=Pristionchus fissidentatus TaxID=1538716 RepID=A0AAV5VNT3_9BILA|nr:hypothetical protein PFISCL1PPCAC_11568 [Pristionchus fissidentatus]
MTTYMIQTATENWRRKSAELAAHSNDAVVPVLSKAFEAIDTAFQPEADPIRIERTLASLASEINLSLQYDSQRNEPTRDLTYDLVDAVHMILSQRKNQSTIGGYSTPIQMTTGDTQPTSSSSDDTPNETNQSDAPEVHNFNFLNGLLCKTEPVTDGEDAEAEFAIYNQVADATIGNADELMKTLGSLLAVPYPQETGANREKRRKSSGESATEMRCVRCEEYGTHSVAGYMKHLRVKHYTTAVEAGISFRCSCGKKCRSQKHYLSKKCLGASVTIVRDGEEEGGGRKRSGEDVKRQTKRAKSEEGQQEPVDEEAAIKQMRKSDSITRLKCIKCEKFETCNVGSYITHLKQLHDTTPGQAGISFLCECGNKSRSNWHFKNGGVCGHVRVSIVWEGEGGEEKKEEGGEEIEEDYEEHREEKEEEEEEDDEEEMQENEEETEERW